MLYHKKDLSIWCFFWWSKKNSCNFYCNYLILKLLNKDLNLGPPD